LSNRDLDRDAGDHRTAREVIHHIADTELVEGLRLRRILAEDAPVLSLVDEEAQARRLRDGRAVETSIGAFQGAVIANALLLGRLADGEWLRAGRIDLLGQLTVEQWLQRMSQHAHGHASQLMHLARRGVV
jgi:hypothetical protein